MLCGEEDFTLLAQSDRYGFDLNKQLCNSCGLVQTYPALSEEFLNTFYAEHYRKLYTKSQDVDYARFEPEQSAKGERFLAFLKEALDGKDLKDFTIIEVGCSSGGILNSLRPHFKAAQGCDLDPAAVAYARSEHGLEAEVAAFPSRLPEGGKIFLLSHVLEHVPNPRELMRQLREAAGSDGYVLIEVPGMNMVSQGSYSHDLRSYFHIAHVADYTGSTLENLLRVTGFETVACDEAVTGLFVASGTPGAEVVRNPADSVENLRAIEKTFKLRL